MKRKLLDTVDTDSTSQILAPKEPPEQKKLKLNEEEFEPKATSKAGVVTSSLFNTGGGMAFAAAQHKVELEAAAAPLGCASSGAGETSVSAFGTSSFSKIASSNPFVAARGGDGFGARSRWRAGTRGCRSSSSSHSPAEQTHASLDIRSVREA